MANTSKDVSKWFSLNHYKWIDRALNEDPSIIIDQFQIRAAILNTPEVIGFIIEEYFSAGIFVIPYVTNATALTDLDYKNSGSTDVTKYFASDRQMILQRSSVTKPLTPFDVRKLFAQTDPELLQFDGDDVCPDPELAGSWVPNYGGPLDVLRASMSVDMHRISKGTNDPASPGVIHCGIDLRYSDEAIIASLKKLLPNWRNSILGMAEDNDVKTHSVNFHIEQIVKYRLIQILDLKIAAASNKTKIPARVMVAKVFAEGEYGEDGYRKVISPLLEKLTKTMTLASLRSVHFS